MCFTNIEHYSDLNKPFSNIKEEKESKIIFKEISNNQNNISPKFKNKNSISSNSTSSSSKEL
jgi:hypothetical protein